MGHALHGLGACRHTTRTMGLAAACRYRRMQACMRGATLHLLVFAQVYIGWSGAILLEASLNVLMCWLDSYLAHIGAAGNYLGSQYPSQNGPQLAVRKLTYGVAVLGCSIFCGYPVRYRQAVVYGVVFVFLLLFEFEKDTP